MSDTPRRAGRFVRVLPYLIAALWAGVVATGAWRGHLAEWAAWAILALSAVAFALHGWDKWRAKREARRVPETVLHTFELLGGWPGALVARHLFRHKTVKLGYRVVFWLCALVNAAVVAGIALAGENAGDLLPGRPWFGE